MSTSYRHAKSAGKSTVSGELRKNTSVSLINYHFVWTPRRRKKVLKNQVAKRLEELIRIIAQDLMCKVIEVAIEPDHVHLFLNSPPDLAPDQLMFRIKGATSRYFRKEFPDLKKMPSMWTRSYFVSTAGSVSSETIIKYIAAQGTRN